MNQWRIVANRMVRKLNFAENTALALATTAVGIVYAPAIRAQSAPSATPKFEVASIKRSKNCGGHPFGKLPHARSPGSLEVCVPLEDLINLAYVVYADGRHRRRLLPGGPPISGGPAWIESDLYEIDAKAGSSASEAMMSGPMMQALLEDRFKLKLHREITEAPVYALTVAKTGPKLQQFKEGSCTPVDLTNGSPPPLASGQKYCSAGVNIGKSIKLVAEATSLDDFCQLLGLVLDRPVIDKTGITGIFEFHLEFAIDDVIPGLLSDRGTPPPTGAPDPVGPSIFEVVQKFGLRLVPTKGPRDFLVIDHVERPSAN